MGANETIRKLPHTPQIMHNDYDLLFLCGLVMSDSTHVLYGYSSALKPHYTIRDSTLQKFTSIEHHIYYDAIYKCFLCNNIIMMNVIPIFI